MAGGEVVGNGGSPRPQLSAFANSGEVKVDVNDDDDGMDEAPGPLRHGAIKLPNAGSVPEIPPAASALGSSGSAAAGHAGLQTIASSRRPPLDRSLSTVGTRIEESVRFVGQRPKGMVVAFYDLTYTVYPRKTCFSRAVPKVLLQSVWGTCMPGEMTALMGPSGSGKTTLLDVISMRKTSGKVEGQILYGYGHASRPFLRRHSGYVEQFDTLVDNMTVYEMLLYTAELKLHDDMPLKEKKERVEAMIRKMELQSCRDTKIGNSQQRGISGGQAKRVNIGVSIITDPMVLYLDEPTSGLDSFTADEVMTFVRGLSDEGMCICATIHSPSPTTFALFHRLLLLVGGRLVYFGYNGKEAIKYFMSSGLATNMPPQEPGREAEWIVQCVTSAGNSGRRDEFADAYNNSLQARREVANDDVLKELYKKAAQEGVYLTTPEQLEKTDPRAGKSTSVPTHYAILKICRYRILKNYQDGMFLSSRLVDKVIALGIITSLFRNMGSSDDVTDQTNIAAALFMWATQPALGAASYIPTIMLERGLYMREINDGLYHAGTYYACKWIQELLLALPASLIFCGIVWGALDLQGNFGIFWIAFLQTMSAAIGVAFTFATLCPTLEFANGAVPSFGGTLMFFVGFLIPLDQIPGWWIWYSYFDYLRYPYVTMMLNQFKNNVVPYQCQGETINGILARYGMEDEMIYMNLLVLLGWALFYALSAYAVLRIVNWSNR